MTSTLNMIEGAAIGVVPATDNLKHGLRDGRPLCIAESSLELSSAAATYGYYYGKIISLLPMIAGVFTKHIPRFISHLDKWVPLQEYLGGIGIFINVARGAKESVSLYRQRQFLSLFETHAWKGANIRNALGETIKRFDTPGFLETLPEKFRRIITGKKPQLQTLLTNVNRGDPEALKKAERIFARWTGRNIRDMLVTITTMPEVELERALPEWLMLDIVNQGGKIYLDNLLKRVDKGNLKAIDEATKLLDTMKSYAAKKQIVHVLRIIGAVISLISCIGFFIAFPWAVTLVFLIVIVGFSAAAYLYNSGYVENREDGFSLKLCIPEFVRNLAVSIWNSPKKFKAWVNAKKPKVLTPHPFFERRIELAEYSKLLQMNRSYPTERLERRTRLAARTVLSRARAA